ncbi:alpha/beta hydrolase [Mycolicibacterium mengxianglii]|uniref:alpha/beta hydrolase n=1 Tax=Mycolicibacterium mengxianglii TaxID=2736649 RepID=UPI0018D147CA
MSFDRIASVGHSIGGYLAIALALRLRVRGEPLPGAILSISPWADVTLSGASIEANASADKLPPAMCWNSSAHAGLTGRAWNGPTRRSAALVPRTSVSRCLTVATDVR